MKYLTAALSFVMSLSRPHPARDWALIVVLGLIGFVVCVGFAVYLFLGIRSGVIVGNAEGAAPITPAVTKGEISSTLEAYTQRSANFDAQNYPRPPLTDPAR